MPFIIVAAAAISRCLTYAIAADVDAAMSRAAVICRRAYAFDARHAASRYDCLMPTSLYVIMPSRHSRFVHCSLHSLLY